MCLHSKIIIEHYYRIGTGQCLDCGMTIGMCEGSPSYYKRISYEEYIITKYKDVPLFVEPINSRFEILDL